MARRRTGGEAERKGAAGGRPGGTYEVRPLRGEDVEAIIAIDALVRGGPDPDRAGFWRGLLTLHAQPPEEAPDDRPPAAFLCEVAVTTGGSGEGTVVGFVIGDVQSWQFGMPRHGRIVTIGVHPDHRRRGAAGQLVASLMQSFRKMGLRRVQCLVLPGDPLAGFFAAAGFERTELQVLERRI